MIGLARHRVQSVKWSCRLFLPITQWWIGWENGTEYGTKLKTRCGAPEVASVS